VEAIKQKEEKRKTLSPRNRKACHSVSTALLKSVADIYYTRNFVPGTSATGTCTYIISFHLFIFYYQKRIVIHLQRSEKKRREALKPDGPSEQRG
jgi:hypothetical protein